MKILYIHGANATSKTFRYIQGTLPSHEIINFDYSEHDPLKDNILAADEIASSIDGAFSLVGHSLGGLIAISILENQVNAQRAVTISTPFGGSSFVEYLRWMAPRYHLFKDVRPGSPIIKEFKRKTVIKPTLQIVTQFREIPVFGEINDGTVTVSSQKSINGVEFREHNMNHFEALMHDGVVEDIRGFLF